VLSNTCYYSTKTQHIQISGFTRQKQKGKTKAQTQDTLFHNIVRVTCVCFVCRVYMTMREREERERMCICACGGPSKYMAHLLWRYKQIIRWERDYSKRENSIGVIS
jgi:hypothetical protein